MTRISSAARVAEPRDVIWLIQINERARRRGIIRASFLMEAAMAKYKKGAALAAAVASLLIFPALAQSPGDAPAKTEAAPTPQTSPGSTAQGMGHMMGGPGMMGMMGQGGMMGMGMPALHVEGWIAFLKAELKITEAQQTLWNAVAEVMRENARTMTGMCCGMMGAGAAASLPDRLAAQEKLLNARLDALHKYKGAVEPLYAALSDDQKKTADAVMPGLVDGGMMGAGMMAGGMMGGPGMMSGGMMGWH
jgi:hypothetical protein